MSSFLSQRKQHHIDVCRSSQTDRIESVSSINFSSIEFIHHALPELSTESISTKTSFLNSTLPFPLFISCMTGGSDEGKKANITLAKAAQQRGLPVGLGSIRILLEDNSRFSDFHLRPYAKDVPILANLGAIQLKNLNFSDLEKTLKRLEVDALVIHLNCGQELFQKGGDRDFTGLKKAISHCVEALDFPIIVKETGFGIDPSLVKILIEMGVTYIDLAGSGGTNWILVEHRSQKNENRAAEEFANWGIPTPALLAANRQHQGRILASGGIRSGMDLAKAIALGAEAGGVALPFIQAALDGGEEEVISVIDTFMETFTRVMLLTGCQNLEQLRQTPLITSSSFDRYVSSLQKMERQ